MKMETIHNPEEKHIISENCLLNLTTWVLSLKQVISKNWFYNDYLHLSRYTKTPMNRSYLQDLEQRLNAKLHSLFSKTNLQNKFFSYSPPLIDSIAKTT